MPGLIKIAGYGGAAHASVIFVHGLGGHAYDTWRRDTKKNAAEDASFWPLWLAEDVAGTTVYALAYEAPASNWLGTSMPLQDRAVNVFEILLSEPGLKTGPIVFICHSLGGLIVKQILLDLQQQKDRRGDAKDFLNRVSQVVFAATPHTGSRHANWLDRLRFFAWPSSIARTLVANDPALRAINVAYRGLAGERRDILKHRVFYETQGTPLGVIVDEASSDPGLPGDPPVPVDATHLSIVKPLARMSLLYARTRDFVAAGAPVLEGQTGELEMFDLPPIRSEQPLNLVPKLIRVAAIGLVGLIGYKGVQALIAEPPPTGHFIEQLQVKDTQIAALSKQAADLTKLLLERNLAAGPGAQQAVGEAVQSITQGAEAGDQRLQQALVLLKENKLAEAEQLLAAFAGDREARAEKATAQAEKDRKEAAVAYRNLGAIAGLGDPKRALEAYEKALALDPDDIESLFQAGWIWKDYGDLGKAQERFEQVLRLTERQTHEEFGGIGLELTQEDGRIKVVTPTDDSPASRGGILPGDIVTAIDGESVQGLNLNQTVDKMRGALDTTVILKIIRGPGRNVKDIRLTRAKIQIKSVSYQKYWAMYGLGDIGVSRGDLKGALKSYNDGLALVESVAKSDPGNAGWQRDLSVSYEKVGGVQEAQGDLTAALQSYSGSLAIRERLAKSDPGNAGWQRDLSVSYGKLALAHKHLGEKAKAGDYLRQGRAIMARLTELSPENAQWKKDLAQFDSDIAKLGDKADEPRAGAGRSKRR